MDTIRADPCGALLRNGDIPEATFGYTACCDGVKYACSKPSFPPNSTYSETYTDPTAVRLIRQCTEAHERAHFNDVTCPRGLLCWRRPKRAEYKDGVDRARSECDGFLAEFNCIQSAIYEDLCDTDSFREQLRAWRAETWRVISIIPGCPLPPNPNN